MEEQLISFKTAKLAKEKGFDEDTPEMYVSNEEGTHFQNSGLPFPSGSTIVDAPTQGLLQKWLRDEKDIHVEVRKSKTTTRYFYRIIEYPKNRTHPDSRYVTYEDALEDGLLEALKLVKNWKCGIEVDEGKEKCKEQCAFCKAAY